MRVNPFYVSNLVGALSQTTLTEQQLTQELSSGVRVNTLSDDPVAVGQNVLFNAQLIQNDSFTQTASSTQGMLQVTDSALGSVVSQLNTAVRLATQGNNGTLNASDVKSISNQLAGIRDEVLSLANTSYLGRFVFAGSQVTTQPFALDPTSTDGTAYYGDSTVSYLHTPNGQSIQMNVPGKDIFLSSSGSVLGALNALVSEFATGSASSASVTAAASLTTALNQVSQQRVLLDNSLSRIQSSQSYLQSESTQVLSAQTTLMEANMGQVATQLSTAETQQAALSQVIAKLGKGSLFDYL